MKRGGYRPGSGRHRTGNRSVTMRINDESARTLAYMRENGYIVSDIINEMIHGWAVNHNIESGRQ